MGAKRTDERPPAELGERLVETDYRLFCTLVRFDAVYFGHFKCNKRAVKDYPALQAYLERIYNQPGVAETVNFDHIKRHYTYTNNDINPINSMGLLSEGQANLSRTTSTTAWWIGTDAPRGLQMMKRRGLEKSMEGDFETDSMRYKSTERYIPNWTDPRTVFGTAGL